MYFHIDISDKVKYGPNSSINQMWFKMTLNLIFFFEYMLFLIICGGFFFFFFLQRNCGINPETGSTLLLEKGEKKMDGMNPHAVLGKVTFKSNALQYCVTPKKVTNYVT